MSLLITDQPKEVVKILYNALDKIIANRIYDGAFKDEEEIATKAYFSTLEGLDALLIPFVNLPKNIFWDPLKAKYPQLIDLITEDIKFVLSFNTQDMPPKGQGDPYFVQGKGFRKTPYWTSECASFTLSVLTNFLELRERFGLTQVPEDQRIMEAIKANLKWSKLCKRDTGWSWTTDSASHPWPTWSILDTFDEMISCNVLQDLHHAISEEFDGILRKIEHSFKIKDVPGTFLTDWDEKVIHCKPYDVVTALDITRLMLAVSLLSNRRTIKPLAKTLFSWASETDFSNIDYRFHLSIISDYIYDSSLIPCIFRTLIIMAEMLGSKRISDLNESIGQNYEFVLNKVYNMLTQNQINHGKYNGLWGVRNGDLRYELYFTERTIEALTEFCLHYIRKIKDQVDAEKDIELTPVLTEAFQEKFSTKAEKLPTEPEEITPEAIIPAYLPILDDVSREMKKEKGQAIFNDFIILFVLHFLNDLPPFIQKFHELGALYEDMYFLVKTYNYPKRDELIRHIKGLGCHVYEPDNSFETTFYDKVKYTLGQAINKAEQYDKKIIIIEDGGYFAPTFHSSDFLSKVNICCGTVEQTTKGHRRDKNIKTPHFPIISIAKSKLKKSLEGQQVASTLQNNIRMIMEEHVKKPLYQINALILGAGTIGLKLAQELNNKKVTVSIYDIDPFKILDSELENFNVLENLKNLTNFDIIIGISGETSLRDFYNLKHNVILVSGSSERIEFELSILDEMSKEIRRDNIITRYTLKKDDKVIRLVLDGEPVNFALSGGIPDAIIDPVYSEMLLAAIEIATNSDLKKKKLSMCPNLLNYLFWISLRIIIEPN